MIGITLVSFISLFGRSLRDADTDAWKSQVTADYAVTSQNGWDAFSAVAADKAKGRTGVELVSHVRGDRGRVGTANAGINGVDPATVARVQFQGGTHLLSLTSMAPRTPSLMRLKHIEVTKIIRPGKAAT